MSHHSTNMVTYYANTYLLDESDFEDFLDFFFLLCQDVEVHSEENMYVT